MPFMQAENDDLYDWLQFDEICDKLAPIKRKEKRNMEYMDPYVMEELMAATVGLVTSIAPSSLLGIATYVLSSLGLYTLASRRGIGNAWLSWVPVLNIWIIGSLSDQYQYVVKGKVKSKRKSLLILNIVNMLIALLMVGICIFMAVELVTSSIYGVPEEELLSVAMGSLFAVIGLLFPLVGVAVAIAVLRYMALYDIYTSTDPANSVLFTVLSILFSVTEPFFLFFNRDKDNGMPPKKPAPQEPVYGIQQENKDYL